MPLVPVQGVVHRARWKGAEVAVKMIRQGRAANPLLKEATALQQLHHPNIVRIFGWVERLFRGVGGLLELVPPAPDGIVCLRGALRTIFGRVATSV